VQRGTSAVLALAALAATSIVLSGSQAAPQGGGGKRSVWEGVYTDAQAKRGKEAYDYSCSSCHSPDLSGDSSRDVPALAGEDFLGEWNAQSVKGLFEVMSKSMPKDAPGSLRAQTYADVLSYLLQSSELPAGTRELAADPAALEQITIEKTRAPR
jgi:quinoprotein glucose dehydrogenase